MFKCCPYHFRVAIDPAPDMETDKGQSRRGLFIADDDLATFVG